MNNLSDRLWDARIGLHLSRRYVASYLEIDESDVASYENGYRAINGSELQKLCLLYGLSVYNILHHRESEDPFEDLKRFRDEINKSGHSKSDIRK